MPVLALRSKRQYGTRLFALMPAAYGIPLPSFVQPPPGAALQATPCALIRVVDFRWSKNGWDGVHRRSSATSLRIQPSTINHQPSTINHQPSNQQPSNHLTYRNLRCKMYDVKFKIFPTLTPLHLYTYPTLTQRLPLLLHLPVNMTGKSALLAGVYGCGTGPGPAPKLGALIILHGFHNF